MTRFLDIKREHLRGGVILAGLGVLSLGCGTTQVEKTDDAQVIEENRKTQEEMSQMERTNQ